MSNRENEGSEFADDFEFQEMQMYKERAKEGLVIVPPWLGNGWISEQWNGCAPSCGVKWRRSN